jgi:DNA polymerase-2
LVEGWIFDVHPLNDKMVVWIKQKNNNSIVRLEDSSWNYSLYVGADNKSDLFSLLNQSEILQAVKDYEFVLKYERITDNPKSKVLRLSLKSAIKALYLAKRIEAFGKKFGRFRLYNVDLLPAQCYFYEKDLFPLAFCDFDFDSKKSNFILQDNVTSTDYHIPDFKSMHLTINLNKKEGKIAKPTDRLSSIQIQLPDEYIEIKKESEADTIKELVSEVSKKIDPDFIFTDDGDSFTFPHLIHRAQENSIRLMLSREPIPLEKSKTIKGEDKNNDYSTQNISHMGDISHTEEYISSLLR